MNFQQIRTAKGSELVAEQIKARITAGDYAPGTKLPSVADLARSFNVGQSTVREALSGLKAIGWLDIRHGSGTYVSAELPAEETPEDPFYKTNSFREIIEVRKYIESGCAELAAKRRTDRDLQQLADILARMEQAVGDEAKSEEADIEFHLRIAEASANSLLQHMMQSLTDRLREHIKSSRELWFFSERSSAEQLLAEHRGIYEAIREGNEAEASRRMLLHLGKVDRTLQRLLKP